MGFFLASARCIIPFPQVRSTTFVFKAPHILGFAKQQKKHSLPAAAAATAAAAASLQKGFKTGLILKHSVQCFKSALHRHRIYQILLNRLYKKVLWSQLSCAMCNPIKKMTIIKFNQVAKKHPVWNFDRIDTERLLRQKKRGKRITTRESFWGKQATTIRREPKFTKDRNLIL